MTHSEWVAATLQRIGKEVQRARKSAGLTQDQLAADVGITRNTLQNIESPTNRRSTIDLLTLILIAERVRTSPIELIYPSLPYGMVEVWPGEEVPSLIALDWFSGYLTVGIGKPTTFSPVADGLLALSREYERLQEMRREVERQLLIAQAGKQPAEGYLFTEDQLRGMLEQYNAKRAELARLIRKNGGTVDA
jgi:transcriptional regulator with XRE-family HTH domain